MRKGEELQARKSQTFGAFVLLLVVFAELPAWPQPNSSPSATTFLGRSADVVKTLQTWYVSSTGLYATTGWWNSANAITVLVDYSRVSKSRDYDDVFANTFTAAQKAHPGFLNKYYDDEGWWALAWIDAYDLTRKPAYLFMAESIFTDMEGGWDGACGGGIWWSKDKDYKNAIANELFLSVAAHLANRTTSLARKQYLGWADKEWQWFRASGMINSEDLINDGLRVESDANAGDRCTNNGKTTWTYNQGVVLGGLAEFYRENHDPALAGAAAKIAAAATTRLADENGILHDPCEPQCGADGVQFKGIFVRNLALLSEIKRDASYSGFISRNADSIWNSARGPNFQLDVRWSGPFVSADAASQTSALDALIAAARLSGASDKGR